MKNIENSLHPFEYIGASKLYNEERFLLADDMGMFKTAQSIFANSKFREKNSKLRTLIVTPTSVREHWARELQKWAYPKGEINLIYTKNFSEGILKSKDSDWTILSYHLMSRLNEDTLKKLKKTGFHHIILDEVHNAKNPSALRTKSIKDLSDQADYLSLLSGTPIPNTMSDLYILMSLLDPFQYPFSPHRNSNNEEDFKSARRSFFQLYQQNPQAVKELLHRKMLRRKIEDFLQINIPELHSHRIEIPLSGFHLEKYLEVAEKDMNIGKKIMDLEKVSIDPLLVENSSNFTRNGPSLKYKFLDNIIKKEMNKKNGKVLVFSNLKKGIIDYLAESYKNFGAIKITGDVYTEDGDRERLREMFQQNPNTRILFSTTTMKEGVDLTAATAVVNLTIPWTPAEYHQRYKRSQRPGEVIKDSLDVYTLFTTIPGTKSSLEQATLEMLDAKEEVVSYLLRGVQLSLEELRNYDEPKRVPRIVKAITSSNKTIFDYFLKWRSIGGDDAIRKIKRSPEMSKYIAELYPKFSMAKNSSEIYIPIIKELEKKENLSMKVDIACGPGMLGYFLDEPTIGIDINKDMLDAGKEIYAKNKLINARMDQLPLRNSMSDLVVCSLSYQMTDPKEERACSLQEMSRVLKNGRYAIITIPRKYMDEQDIQNFKRISSEYGFGILDHQREVGESKIDFYVLQKNHEPSKKLYNLQWRGDLKWKDGDKIKVE